MSGACTNEPLGEELCIRHASGGDEKYLELLTVSGLEYIGGFEGYPELLLRI